MKLQIACIPGDGIGPEIVAQANKVLDQVAKKFGHEIERKEILMGGASIDVHGVPLTDEAIADATLTIIERIEDTAEIPTPPPGTSSLRKSVRKQVC
jgi:isocitrate/isopropylmalate dehydrogenase